MLLLAQILVGKRYDLVLLFYAALAGMGVGAWAGLLADGPAVRAGTADAEAGALPLARADTSSFHLWRKDSNSDSALVVSFLGSIVLGSLNE
jgi:hypothetical protein